MTPLEKGISALHKANVIDRCNGCGKFLVDELDKLVAYWGKAGLCARCDETASNVQRIMDEANAKEAQEEKETAYLAELRSQAN